MSSCLDQALNASNCRILANDKIVTYSLLSQLGFPIPETVATFNRKGRRIGAETQLATLGDVTAFLHSSAAYPLFIKPVCGTYGRGALGLAEYLRDTDRFRLLDGSIADTHAVLSDMEFPPYDGKLFQKVLIPHAAIVEITGPRVSCVRLIVVLVGGVPHVHTVFWKVVTGSNVMDNFSLGARGNLLAAVDVATGTIGNVHRRPGAVNCG